MRKLLLFIAFIALVNCASAQKYEAMLTRGGSIVYLDDSGNWLTKDMWIEKYSRKTFRAAYPDDEYYSHIQEVGFIRTNFRESVSSLSVGDIRWSRIFDSEATTSDLKISVKAKFSRIIEEREDVIVGVVEDVPIVASRQGIPGGLYNSAWSGVVRYEFKEGRYRVTVESIRTKLTKQVSTAVYLGFGASVGASDENMYESIYSMFFYSNGKPTNAQRWSSLSNCIDFNLSSYLYIQPLVEW